MGGFRVVYEQANQLVARGDRVTVVHARSLPNWRAPLPSGPVRKLRRLAGNTVRSVKARLNKPTIDWQRIDPRVELIFSPRLKEADLPPAEALIASWWATVEMAAGFSPDKGLLFHYVQGLETWMGQRDRVETVWRLNIPKLVVSGWLYDVGLGLGVDPALMARIPNGLDHDRYRCLRPFEDRPLRAAMPYSGEPVKGGADGLAALKAAKEKLPELIACLFGTGPAPVGLPDWMTYHRDPAQDFIVTDIYNGSRIFVCPSRSEGWGLPPAEAMACGCAAAVTDCGGPADFAHPGRTALVSPIDDPAALAANIVALGSDPALAARLAQAGRVETARLTWPASAAKLAEFIRSSLERNGARPKPADVRSKN